MITSYSRAITVSFISENCSGCGCCAALCHCLKMIQNEDGFRYPELNTESCTNCGRCSAICPMKNPIKKKDAIPDAYAMKYSDDSVVMQSSSGGIFTSLARWIFEHDGIVYGAAFDATLKLRHCPAECEAELSLLRGSKYIQSDAEIVFPQLKAYLEAGRWVLFVGTPCQVAGLKKYLGKDYRQCLTTDLICHGVPSELFFRKYLNEMSVKNNINVYDVLFRDKSAEGWNNFHMVLRDKEGRYCYSNSLKQDIFLQGFLSDVCLRPSCYKCPYATIPRQGDITLGDFWKIEKIMPEFPHQGGVSAVLLNSEKGKEWFTACKMSLTYCEVPLASICAGNATLLHPTRMSPMRKVFMHNLKCRSVFWLHKHYLNRKRIAVKLRRFWYKITKNII